jgi:hypothetical protein
MVIAAVMQVIAVLNVHGRGADAHSHIRWLQYYTELVPQGEILPRWMPQGFGGLGSPAFYFYPPLTYWIGAPVWAMLSPMEGMHRFTLVALYAGILSFFSLRYALRQFDVERSLSFWAAMLYVVAPLRLFEIFSRSGLSSIFVLIWLPFVAAGLMGVYRDGKDRRAFIHLLIGISAIILTNIPALIVLSIFIALYYVALLIRTRSASLTIPLAVIASFAITAFYWLPIPTLQQYLQQAYLTMSKDQLFDVIGAAASLTRKFNITESVNTLMLYASAAVLLFLLWRTRKEQTMPRYALMLVGTCLSLYLAFASRFITGPIWSMTIVQRLIQFPYRFSMFVLITLAICYAMWQGSGRRIVLGLVIAWAGMACFSGTISAFDFRVNPRLPDKTPYEPPEYAPRWSSADMYANIRLADQHLHDSQIVALRTLGDGESIKLRQFETRKQTFEVDLASPATVRFQQWHWPLWRLTNEKGYVIPLQPDRAGLETATLPAGKSRYVFELQRSSSEIAGMWISIISLLASVALFSRKKAKG